MLAGPDDATLPKFTCLMKRLFCMQHLLFEVSHGYLSCLRGCSQRGAVCNSGVILEHDQSTHMAYSKVTIKILNNISKRHQLSMW